MHVKLALGEVKRPNGYWGWRWFRASNAKMNIFLISNFISVNTIITISRRYALFVPNVIRSTEDISQTTYAVY